MNLNKLKETITATARQYHRDPHSIKILAASKNQPVTRIREALDLGHRIFGENRVQEARKKWNLLKEEFPDIELHLIGHLQTNKVKEAVKLFDVIQTLDSVKLAEKLTQEELRQNKKLRYFIEINMGEEIQKSGVMVSQAHQFIATIRENYPLNLVGVMCIPPSKTDPVPFFKKLVQIAKQHGLDEVSMGMSEDFQAAIACGATLVRIGEALFGNRCN
jgi:pyridoxal phosphate enzyme (YggS family)